MVEDNGVQDERRKDVGGREARMELSQGKGKDAVNETPLSKKWTEMDELQYPRESLRKVLESILGETRHG
jgi:hypothetical protein